MAQKLHGVHAVETLTVYVEQENLIKETEENCKQSNNEEATMTRKISTLPEQGSYPRGPHKERSGHLKEKHQFRKILQSAVFLIYVCWLPIVVRICFLNSQRKISLRNQAYNLISNKNRARFLEFNNCSFLLLLYIGACDPKAPRIASTTFCTDVPS